MENVSTVLVSMLLKDEQVLLVSKGEIRFRKTIIVLTNLRMLLMNANRNEHVTQPYWSIYYSQIKDLKSTIFGNAKICLKDGKNLNYSGFPKIDRKTMREVFLDAYKKFEEKGFDPEVSQSRENLCGNCFAVVPKHEYHCEACGATFWKPSEVGIRSFFFPSWGDFVMKHYPVAFAEFCGFMILLVVMAAVISNGDYGLAVILFVLANRGDAAIAAQIAAKGLHLKTVPESQST